MTVRHDDETTNKGRAVGAVAAVLAFLAALILAPAHLAGAHSAATYYPMTWVTETAHQHCDFFILNCQTHPHGVDIPNYVVGSGWDSARIARVQGAMAPWNNATTAGAYFNFTYNGSASLNAQCAFNQANQNGHRWAAIDGKYNTAGWTEKCTVDGEHVSSYMITYDTAETWYTGTGTPAGTQGDFLSVVVHELGHATGFSGPYQNGHFDEASTACPDPNTNTARQTMCPSVGYGATWPRTLGYHDEDTFCAAYPGMVTERACLNRA